MMKTTRENPLKKAVHSYISRFYPNLGNPPDVQLLTEKGYDSIINFHSQGATYDEMDDTIYFKEIATPTVICREVHRWAQCQKLGEQYCETIRNPGSRLILEQEANIAATEAVYRHKRLTQSFRLLDNQIIEFFK
jgi:hypothetical protein